MDIFRKLTWFFKEQKAMYIRGLLALMMTAFLNMIPPFLIGYTVNQIVAHSLTPLKLALILLGVGAEAVTLYAFRYIWAVHIWGGATYLERKLRQRLYMHFMHMDTKFYQKYRTGDLMTRATNDLIQIRQVAGMGILTLVDSLTTGMVTIITMAFVVDWRLTLVAILPFPLLAIMSIKLGHRMHNAFGDQQRAFSKLSDKVQESLSGMKAIKTLGQEAQDIEDFNAHNGALMKAYKKVELVSALYDPLTTMIIVLAYVVTIVYGGWMVLHHQINIGQLVSFISYLSMLIWPMFAIGQLFNIIERGNASYDRVMDILSNESHIKEATQPVTIPAQGDVHFAIKQFQYPDDPEIALQDIDVTVAAGHTLGIVGQVGAGKTSLLKLLLRQYDNYDGVITLNGADIRQFPQDTYLRAIGYVPQEGFLFSTSIKENIRFACPDASDEQVQAAAQKAAFHDDIMKMPAGYETEVGEHGISLSGGQRQRLAIARALLIDPEILILDDSLSAVDARTEAAILDVLKRERANKTTIIAAHRMSSVMNAENIIVFDNGQIKERGTHSELLAKHGWYAMIYQQQQHGMSETTEGGEA